MKMTQPTAEELGSLAGLYSSGDFIGLEAESRGLLARYPEVGFLWQVLGVALNAQKKDGLDALQKAVALLPYDAEARNNLGNALKDAGRLDEAETSYRQALALKAGDPVTHYNLGAVLQAQARWAESAAAYRQAVLLHADFAPAHYNLGTVLEELGDAAGAEACYRRVLQCQPDDVLACYNLGRLLQHGNRPQDAEACYRRVLALQPDFVDAHHNLALVLKELGALAEAEAHCRGALELEPGSAAVLNSLGLVLHAEDRLAEAEQALRTAVALDPGFADAYGNLGKVLHDQERFAEAENCLRQALELKPDSAEMHTNLGATLVALSRPEAAEKSYRIALQLQPGNADYLYNLGYALQEQSRYGEAEAIYRQALTIKPDFPVALNNLGLVLGLLGFSAEAEANCLQALEQDPDSAKFYANLGGIRTGQGRHAESEAAFRRALELDPEFHYALSNILYSHTFDGRRSAAERLEDVRSYGRLVSAKAAGGYTAWQCAAAPQRLRVGLVSGDLRDHSVGHFLEGFLQQIDPARIELLAYPTHREFSDLSVRIKPYFAGWYSLVGLSDEAAARRIHADGVHVLVDLSGHTGHNRLPVFAWKPAPVQASWLGYCASTGVAEIDYYIADGETLPVAQEAAFTEQIWRLPASYLCFSQPAEPVEVNTLPALANGHLTFGSFNNLSKMTSEVVALWAQLLHALPDSRLLLKAKQLGEASTRDQVLAQYAAHGIGPERLLLEGPIQGRSGHLAAYQQVDIGLDPFPYNGVTTTMEALWMGVPVLTLSGERFLARQGVGILTHAGLPEWIAADGAELVAKARAQSRNLPALAVLRTGLRERLLASPLLDTQGFARDFENALWGMWQKRQDATPVGRPDALPLADASPLYPAELSALSSLFAAGRYRPLENRARLLLRQNPTAGPVWKALGLALDAQGQDSLSAMRRAVELLPDDAEAHNNLGLALNRLGCLDQAERAFRQAIALQPAFAFACNNLAMCLSAQGRLDEAERASFRAIELMPDYAEGLCNRGVILKSLGRLGEAESSYRLALQLRPDYAEAHYNLAVAGQEQGRLSEAEAGYHKALQCRPQYAEALCNLGALYREQGRLVEAEDKLRQSLAINPNYAGAYCNLGVVEKDFGRLEQAEVSYLRALELEPGFSDAFSNLLFAYNYSHLYGPERCLAEAQRYGALVAGKARPYVAWSCPSTPTRLRVGLVSGDLRDHPVGHFLESVVKALDSERIELIAYPTHHEVSPLTRRIQPCFAAWKPLHGLSDEAAARLIHDDGLHLLIDLAGHTAHNRLPVFAWKPAPVQASWLGYFATTGVAAIDYLLADAVGVPADQRGQFTEEIVYLPDTRLCFTPPDRAPAVAPSPGLANGYVTFGCFQNLTKITDPVLAVWSRILSALPTARLRLQNRQLGDAVVREQLQQRLRQQGIEPSRVALLEPVSRAEYLAAHGDVDCLLDTFPYPGGTTTCEALWMGVPTLTLAGDGLLARQGASLLTAAGLPGWVAATADAYVAKAIAQADDLAGLAALRAELRGRVGGSPLIDAPRFARNLEAACWAMWSRYQSKAD
ncbi:tetratricopeptide repeat protein [Dechloromonas denitrificans]|nr:tetratricopeptide repeat protein [Dechloromonas denitrificans]